MGGLWISGTTGELLDSHFWNCSGSLATGLEICDIRIGNFKPNLDFRRSSFVVLKVGRTGDAARRVEPLERLKDFVTGSFEIAAPWLRTWRPEIPCFESQKTKVYIGVSECLNPKGIYLQL